MEKLSKEEVLKERFTTGFFLQTLALRESMEKLEIGEGLKINANELPYAMNHPTSGIFNSYFKKEGKDIRFKMRRIQHGKEFVFIRIN